ncbi:hypothetical protein FB008_11249 [Sinorhizobium medicae]|nr:hypothetical protein [Sinorhizobium medicae]TWA50538.1 hypothetical protein FB008_11249 [Sinorhizobium medicae]
MKHLTITAAVCLLNVTTVFAQDISKITCSFRAEGFEGGKSNVVS